MKGSPLRGLMTWACDDWGSGRGRIGRGCRRVDEFSSRLLLRSSRFGKGGRGGLGFRSHLPAAARTTTDLTAGLWTETRRGCIG